MTSRLPPADHEAPVARVDDTETLLARIACLESELAAFRPPRPPPGWLPVKTVAEKLRLTDVAVYKMARLGRIASTKVIWRLWAAPITVRPDPQKV